MNSILVTGGCGFIGSNFVRLLLSNNASLLKSKGFDRVINVDALTYAGNPENLADLESSDAYVFAHNSILDQDAIEVLEESQRILSAAVRSRVTGVGLGLRCSRCRRKTQVHLP